MKIHWFVYLFVGVFVILVTFFINSIVGDTQFDKFVFIGYLFVILGVIKILSGYMTDSQGEKDSPKKSVEKKSAPGRHHFYPCPACKTQNHVSNRYCRRCGVYLRG